MFKCTVYSSRTVWNQDSHRGKKTRITRRILFNPVQEIILPILRKGGQNSIPETE